MNVLPDNLLVIEAATAAGSVALVIDGVVVAERDVAMGVSRQDALLPAIADVLRDAHVKPNGVRAIACGSGPGSFTSLRIATALAKGLAVANEATLYAVPSLLLAAASLRTQPGLYVVHSDALRGDRYAQTVRVLAEQSVVVDGHVQRISLADLNAMSVANKSVKLFAVGTQLVSEFDVGVVQPHARDIVALQSSFATFGPVSIATWEPEYGRAAEAQVKWEVTHGRPLPSGL